MRTHRALPGCRPAPPIGLPNFTRGAGLAALAAALLACGDAPKPAATPPARVQNAVPEAELSTVTLTPEAERRLGVETAEVTRRPLARTRTLGGEVVVPPGGSITVSAPVAGTVLPLRDQPMPRSGERVSEGRALLRLVALPPDRDVLRAEEELSLAEVRLGRAKLEADRFAQLYRERAATAQEHEVQQAALASATTEVRAARARLARLRGERSDANTEALSPLVIGAPRAGVIRDVHAAAGQTVASAAPLFELVSVDELWVRVPVYVGDLAALVTDRPALVHALGGEGGAAAAVSARPVVAPPSADAAAASAHVFFALANDGARWRPGERVGVTLALRGPTEESLVVPWSAIVHDVHGGTWVYERVAPQRYARRRVEVRSVNNGVAALARGPAAGATIVTAAAAELYGTEFGAGK